MVGFNWKCVVFIDGMGVLAYITRAHEVLSCSIKGQQVHVYMYNQSLFVCFCYAEDLMQLVTRLDQCRDLDGSCRLARQILEFLELHSGDYRLNQVREQLVNGWLKLSFSDFLQENLNADWKTSGDNCVSLLDCDFKATNNFVEVPMSNVLMYMYVQ